MGSMSNVIKRLQEPDGSEWGMLLTFVAVAVFMLGLTIVFKMDGWLSRGMNSLVEDYEEDGKGNSKRINT